MKPTVYSHIGYRTKVISMVCLKQHIYTGALVLHGKKKQSHVLNEPISLALHKVQKWVTFGVKVQELPDTALPEDRQVGTAPDLHTL